MRFSITEAASLVLLSLCVERAMALPLADNSTEPFTDLEARATGDSAADPILKEFDCTDSNAQYPGLQELFDADCYTHVCGQAPVTMNRWDQSSRNRGVEYGNGVGSRQIFVDLNKYHTTRPGNDEISPEEWPPASTAQGGQNAILIPVTRAAQNRQKVLINNKFYAKTPTVAAQKGVNGSKKGSWFRITKFNGAKGPYCQALNDKLANYAANFDSNGRVKTTPAICKPKAAVNLNGLKYDVGLYSYQLNIQNRQQYLKVLKAL